jgi:hypothetical protein
MNVRPIVTIRLARRNGMVHVTRLVDDVRSLRHVRFRRLFNHDAFVVQREGQRNALFAAAQQLGREARIA